MLIQNITICRNKKTGILCEAFKFTNDFSVENNITTWIRRQGITGAITVSFDELPNGRRFWHVSFYDGKTRYFRLDEGDWLLFSYGGDSKGELQLVSKAHFDDAYTIIDIEDNRIAS